MAITKIESTRHLESSVNYLFGKSHNKNVSERALETDSIYCVPGYEKEMMMDTLRLFGKADGKKVQGQLVTISFGKDEMDWKNEDDIEKARKVMERFVRKSFPNHQALAVVQADGENEVLHVHAVVSNVDMITGKSMRGRQASWTRVSKITDEVIQDPDINLKPLNKTIGSDKKTIGEIKMTDRNEYVWKDDLKSRISEVMKDETVNDKTSYFESLQKNGVDARERGKGISYAFVDDEGKQRRVRSSKLGTLYGKEEIEKSVKQSVKTRTKLFDLDSILNKVRSEPKAITKTDNVDFNEALRKADELEAQKQAEALREAQKAREEQIEPIKAKTKHKHVEEPKTTVEDVKKPAKRKPEPKPDFVDMSEWYTKQDRNESQRKQSEKTDDLEL